jgi:GWxTD domain-containing protein
MPRARLLTPLLTLSLACVVSGCGASRGGTGGSEPRAAGRRPSPTVPRGAQALSFDATALYRQMGMLARGMPFPLLGRIAAFASPSPDTTHVVVAVSFPAIALSFARQSDTRFRASYLATIELSTEGQVVARRQATQEVLVGTYRETTRGDESIFHQEVLDVPPGSYALTVTVRDPSTQRSVEERATLRVPRLGAGGIGTPVPVLEATARDSIDSLPALVIAPAGTAVIGRDSLIPVYMEAYDAPEANAPLRLLIRNESGRVLWSDTLTLPSRRGLASGIVEIPVSRIGIGVGQLSLTREGARDTVSSYVFVSFGAGLPVATYDDMLFYLRYYAIPARITALREAAPEQRPAAWSAFVQATDPDPRTTIHEELSAYFDRLVRANTRFSDEAGVGWQSDRGRVFIVLGEPDQLIEPQLNDMSRNRQQVWIYQAMNLQLTFFDQTGTGRWRLTQASEVRFETEFRRRLK